MGANDRLRVAHVITRMIVGGAQETVLLAAALADRERFAPVIVCGPQTGSEGSLHADAARRGVELVVVPDLVREVRPAADARALAALIRLFRDRDIDVVHTNSSKAGILGRLAARRASVPRVLHSVHGWPFHEGQSAVASAVWTQLERRTARFAERLVVVADVDRQKGLNAGIGRPEQYRTVRSGLELDQYVADQRARMEVRDELGIPASAFVIGSVCRLSPQKDPLLLLEGALPVLRAHSDARLLLVGDGPLRGAVESVVLGSGVADQVLLTGLRRDVPRLLNAMDLFVLSSRWEGLPRTLIQAMATGVPVVATDADGVREVVVDGVTGWLVSRGSAAGLAAAVRQAIAEPERRRAMASAAGARLPEFDAVTMVRQLESLYIGHE